MCQFISGAAQTCAVFEVILDRIQSHKRKNAVAKCYKKNIDQICHFQINGKQHTAEKLCHCGSYVLHDNVKYKQDICDSLGCAFFSFEYNHHCKTC